MSQCPLPNSILKAIIIRIGIRTGIESRCGSFREGLPCIDITNVESSRGVFLFFLRWEGGNCPLSSNYDRFRLLFFILGLGCALDPGRCQVECLRGTPATQVEI